MEIKASSLGVHIAPRKIRLVADTIRRQDPLMALATLSFVKKRAAKVLEKILKSALANARNRNLKEDDLMIKNIDILEGPSFKRYHPSTRGRVHPYKKRTTHIKIVLSDDKAQKEVKEDGTKS